MVSETSVYRWRQGRQLKCASDRFPTLDHALVTRSEFIEEFDVQEYEPIKNRYILDIVPAPAIFGVPRSEIDLTPFLSQHYVNYRDLTWGIQAISVAAHDRFDFRPSRRSHDFIKPRDVQFELFALPADYDAWDAPFSATVPRFRPEYRTAAELSTREVVPLRRAVEGAPEIPKGYLRSSRYSEVFDRREGVEVTLDLTLFAWRSLDHRKLCEIGGINYRNLYWNMPAYREPDYDDWDEVVQFQLMGLTE